MSYEANESAEGGAQSAADEAEVIDGEYSEEAAGGDVPLPDDLLDDGSGSPRYPLPDDLVKYRYDAVPVQTVPQPVALTERIIVAVPATTTGLPQDHLGAYEAVASVMEPAFPVRVAYLRDLYAACRLAEQRKAALIAQREAERMALNWRNSVNNRQIDTDLGTLKDGWEKGRGALHQEMREAQNALIEYRMTRQKDIEEARIAFWDVRAQAAQLRDERHAAFREEAQKAAAEQAERDREARDRALERGAEAEAERKQQRERLRQEASTAETAAQEAEAAACQAEDAAIERQGEESGAAWDRYQGVLRATQDRIEADGEVLRAAAETEETALLNERREREEWLHAVQREAVAEGRDRELHLHQARREAAAAAAQAGLAPGEAEADHRAALKEQLTEDVVAEGTSTRHLVLDDPAASATAPPRWRQHLARAGHTALHLVLLVGLGGIFGASLGLLTGMLDFTPEGMRHGGAFYFAVFALLGVVLYRVMGMVAHRAAAYASEEMHADRHSWRTGFAVAGAATAVAGMIGLEAFVERYGIVQSVIALQLENGGSAHIDGERSAAYWAIALVFAAPFVVLHAYEGAADTRRRLAERRRREQLARRQHEAASDPRNHAITETQEVLRAARLRHEAIAAHHAPGREEAERRIAEIDRLLQAHPAIVRWREYAASRDALLDGDPILAAAKTEWERAQNAHRTDPAAVAARQRAESLRTVADAANRQADQAESVLLQALEEAARGIIASTGVGLAQALGDHIEAGVDAAAQAFQGGAPAAGGGALPLLSLAQQALMAPPPRETETWAEAMARERWDSLRNAISHDPKMRFYQARIASLQTAIHGLDTQYGKRRRQLLDQKRAIELRIAASEESNRASAYIENAINEEDLNAKAAKQHFDEECARLRELAESPKFFRWYIAWMQRRAARGAQRRQIQAIQNVRLLPARSATDPGAA